MFHDVRNIESTHYPKRYSLKSFLSEKQFLYQVQKIKSKYKIISSLESHNLDLGQGNIDYAVLTFDDGLRDHYSVYKILQSLGLSGTFFIPKDAIEQRCVMNTHKIQFILASVDETRIKEEILGMFVNKEDIWNTFSLSSWRDNWWTPEMVFVTNFLRKFKNKTTDCYQITDHLFQKFVTKDEVSFANDLYLSESNIEEMSNSNMIIGGHGGVSENLLLLSNFEDDLNNSKKFVSKFSDNFVFSYPNGGFSDQIKDHLRKISCLIAYTTHPCTLTDLDHIDYLEYPRYDAPQKICLP